MPRYDDLIANIGSSPIFCSNLGFGEQGAVLSKLDSAIYICPDIDKARKMQDQLSSLNKSCVVIDDFNKPFTLAKFQSNENKIDIIKTKYALTNSKTIIISTPQILFSCIENLDNFKKNIVNLRINAEYDLIELEKNLISLGYNKVDNVTTAGEFSRRGDIIDIFNIISDNPTRLDFFDTTLEEIYSFDFLTYEKKNKLSSFEIVPAKTFLISNEEKQKILNQLNKIKIENSNIFEVCSFIEHDEDVPLEYLYPFSNNITTFAELNLPIIISNEIQFETLYSKYFEFINNKIETLFEDNSTQKIFKKYLKIDNFFEKTIKNISIFENFDINSTEISKKIINNNLINLDFKTVNFSNFLFNLEKLKTETKKFNSKQIYLCLGSTSTLNAIKKIFDETATPYTQNKNGKGLILTTLNIPYNICFEDEEKFYIGSSNFAHKKEFKGEQKKTVKYLPKAGEYVVHSVHGIGKCEGIVSVNVGGVDKEFFKLIYRGGDCLYVPYENADCLSLYLCDGGIVTLNKLGGKEFSNQKQRAIQSIEVMSKDLLELYAKRKATKGIKYPEDDYLYLEFENAFEFEETLDQLQAIEDVKHDMETGKVMDRLICGDVGFGKTEVAMRALFKAVESGKQVAILAPTTILSLQHFMSTKSRTKDFGVNVEMLNRFKTNKEQKQIIEDLKDGKINVICGTHRLLSKDVKFKDLGLLILDEEQRFGVKAKEQIKQIKNNIDVLTLSATPIPRTLSMTLMSIRDISIINTPPTNRLAVKTYVLGYNEEIVANAINDEINRGGQVLVVFNDIKNIDILANKLKQIVNNPSAVFDVAHGQMSEIALENAIKRLYDRETNVMVSTTLIENGIDLPKANTLIVLDSDKLGLSQMYQLRGRVGRSNEQAYAYFTFNKDKILTEDSTNRLQAIAENTELGSGFKIAMRDLQIRGAGELLGKIQHGHMVKIGYDMYTKLLNETLRRLKGEKVETEREIKIDIAITSKIPETFISDETERLKIIAKISNITSKEDTRKVLNELLVTYGKLPKEIYQLTNIALIKALAIKQKIKQITITKSKMQVTFYDDVDIKKLMQKVNKFPHFHFEKGSEVRISLNISNFSVQTAMIYIIEFLNTQI